MMAIAIFGFLMLSISQLMRQEIRLYNAASQKNEINQKARTAMMHVLDQIRLNKYTYYKIVPGGLDGGVYYYPTQTGVAPETPLINEKPSLLTDPSLGKLTEIIYYDAVGRKLWYKDCSILNSTPYLVADQIYQFSLQMINDIHFIQITIVAGDPNTPQHYELVTWARLY